MGDELSASALQLRARAAGSQLHARARPARVRRAGRVGATTGPRLTRSRCPPHLWGVGVQRRNVLPIYGELACSAGMSSPFMGRWRAAPECPPHLWGGGVQRRNVLPIYGEVACSAGMSSPFMGRWRAAPECPPHLWGVGVQRRNVLLIYGEVPRRAGGAEASPDFAVSRYRRRSSSRAYPPLC